jgi:hypothetical protein
MTEEQHSAFVLRATAEQLSCTRSFTLVLDAMSVSVLIGNLQLALRHPDNGGAAADVCRHVVAELLALLRGAGLSHSVFLAELGNGEDVPLTQ